MNSCATVEVSREQVLAYRFAAHQLDRSARSLRGLRILDLGLQDSADSARLSVAARCSSLADPAADRNLALAWTLRGSPHLHRRRDLDALAGALWPLSEADATTRLGRTGAEIKKHGESPLGMLDVGVAAMRRVVTEPMTKGAASAAVTREIPEVLSSDCRACRTVHVSDLVMRLCSAPAGLELTPGSSPPILAPRAKAPLVHDVDEQARDRLIRDYLTVNGPATPAEVAWFLGGRKADVAAHWPSGLTEVSVEGRRGWLPNSRLAALRSAQLDRAAVRLLAPFDLYMQTSDRELLVPDRVAQKALWPVLGRPGAVITGGDVVGWWRPAKAGRRLTVTVHPFTRLPAAARRMVESEAQGVGEIRGTPDVRVTWS